jgi:hypothetical protein
MSNVTSKCGRGHMRIAIVIAAVLLMPLVADAQYYHNLGPIDTLTTGAADDASPSIEHGWFEIPPGSYTWLVFTRTVGGSSLVCGMRHKAPDLAWPQSITPISAFHPPGKVRRPGAAASQYYVEDSASQTFDRRSFRVAAWEQQVSGVWNIWYSASADETTWTAPVALTNDSLDNTDVQVRMLRDSTIVVAWRRGAQLLGTHLTPHASSGPVALATSSDPAFEYDTALHWEGLNILWTSREQAGSQVVAWRRLLSSSSMADSLTPPDTLDIPRTIGSPVMVPWYWSSQPLLMFEADENGTSDVFGWSSDSWPGFTNLSDDPESNDRNPATAFCPIVTLRKGNARQWITLDVSVFERQARGDSSLVFWPGDYLGSDTVRSEGHNRNAAVGTGFFPAGNGYFYYPVVWESNRTGRNHLYGTFVQSIFASVDDPVTQPATFELDQNYPNPFNGETVILLRMSPGGGTSGTASVPARSAGTAGSHVTLNVYDLLGQRVASIYDGPLGPGPHQFTWAPHGLASGMYICRVAVSETGTGPHAIRQIKMLHLR